MAETTVSYDEARAEHPGGAVGDYIALLKPRVMSLVIFTALTGLLAAPGPLHPFMAIVALLAIAVGAGASGALNMWWDADIDARMERTQSRPIPQGRVTPEEAATFGLVLSIGSVITLGVIVDWLAAALLALTIAFYVVVYTMWLKRWTPQNIVIGGAAGAFPPMIGWAATTGTVSIDSVLLFLIIFLWTPPHFWALALVRSDDYSRVGVPMLPVVAGAAETRRQILLYSVLLVGVSLAPLWTGLGGVAYGVAAVALGAGFLALACRLWAAGDAPHGARRARQLFGYSILYLFLLFAVILGEHAIQRIVG
ncbi:MAG: heme o synthase [Hyphomicrobiaceae bacterium]